MVHECMGTNSDGNLTVGNVDTVRLAKEYGTPLYVFNENQIRNAMRSFKKSIDVCYDGNGIVCYASKAFSCKEIYRIAKEEEIGVDVVSGGELYTALSVDFPSEKIVFHGNNKTLEELDFAIKNGVGRIVADNFDELLRIDEISAKYNKKTAVMLRLTPGIDAHTHDFVKTGMDDSKFGFTISTGVALKAVIKTLEYKNIEFKGIHCHIGSQIFQVEPFCHTAEVMLRFMNVVREKTGKVIEELNLGGGFGIKYVDGDTPLPYQNYMQAVSTVIKDITTKMNYPIPKIFIEPGRAIVGSAGVTLYTVGSVKTIEGIRTYVAIDGGMTDNPRYALYNASYDIEIANRMNEPKDFTATVAGKCCESGDLIQEDAVMQKVSAGDIMAVMSTGAYNYSMASNYNRIPKAAVVFVKDDEDRLVVKRQTYEDVASLDV